MIRSIIKLSLVFMLLGVGVLAAKGKSEGKKQKSKSVKLQLIKKKVKLDDGAAYQLGFKAKGAKLSGSTAFIFAGGVDTGGFSSESTDIFKLILVGGVDSSGFSILMPGGIIAGDFSSDAADIYGSKLMVDKVKVVPSPTKVKGAPGDAVAGAKLWRKGDTAYLWFRYIKSNKKMVLEFSFKGKSALLKLENLKK